jgi:hypothetical protein
VSRRYPALTSKLFFFLPYLTAGLYVYCSTYTFYTGEGYLEPRVAFRQTCRIWITTLQCLPRTATTRNNHNDNSNGLLIFWHNLIPMLYKIFLHRLQQSMEAIPFIRSNRQTGSLLESQAQAVNTSVEPPLCLLTSLHSP